jgi:transcriptional regulator with XRE-family HTH domain
MPRPNSSDPKQSPAALLGRRLRRLRQAVGFASQEAGARAMGYAREVVTKAESGERVPTDQVFRTYLETFHATPGQAESLAEDLELARNLTDPVIPEFAEPWLDVEPEAAIIRLWALDVMPGLLQRYEYARAMNLIGGQDDDKAAARAAARVERAAILEGPEPTRLTAILYEPLLRRIVGTPEIMAAELEHLLEMSQRPNLIIQVVREAGYFAGHEGGFAIASGRTIPDTLNMITVEDQTTSVPAVVDRAIALFERVRGYALPIGESRTLIQEALQGWKSQR